MVKKRQSINAKSTPSRSIRMSSQSTSNSEEMESNTNPTTLEKINEAHERLEATSPIVTEREQYKRTTSLSSRLSRVIDKVRDDVRSTWDLHLVANPIITTLRDFAFPIQEGVIVFFSTHPLLCKGVFGFDHGETFVIGRGVWSGQEATVIGVRGNLLWIVLAGNTFAQVLPTPPPQTSLPSILESSSPSPLQWEQECEEEESQEVYKYKRGKTMRECFCKYYKITFVSGSQNNMSAEKNNNIEQDKNNNVTKSVADKLFSLLWKEPKSSTNLKNYSKDMALTKTERDFLQNAPDLFVELVTEESHTNDNDNVKIGLRSSTSEQVRPKELHVHEIEDLYRHSSQKHNAKPSLNSENVKTTANDALIKSASMIVLSPCMLPGNKALGWSGEGSVVVPQTYYNNNNNNSNSSVNNNMTCAHASLSASIVMHELQGKITAL